jgi:hypothetical protein
MPFIIPFIPLIAAGVGAAGLADTIYNQVNAPSQTAPTPTPVPTGPQPQSTQTNQAQTAAAASALPTLQSLTGGSLSPEYAAQFAGLQTGTAGNPQASGNVQSAVNQFFGLNAPGTSGLSPTSGAAPQSNALTDILARLTQAQGGGIVDQTLADSFKGFS